MHICLQYQNYAIDWSLTTSTSCKRNSIAIFNRYKFGILISSWNLKAKSCATKVTYQLLSIGNRKLVWVLQYKLRASRKSLIDSISDHQHYSAQSSRAITNYVLASITVCRSKRSKPFQVSNIREQGPLLQGSMYLNA